MKAVLHVFFAALKLGLTSFGGPIAHIGYYRDEYVTRRRWLGEKAFADLVALCQFLPGPASSQLGMAIGGIRAGFAGAVAAWIGFTLPSALLMLLAVFLADVPLLAEWGLLRGLKIVAVAIVAHAVVSMWKKLVTGTESVAILLVAVSVLLLWHSPFAQIAIIGAAGIYGCIRFFIVSRQSREPPISRKDSPPVKLSGPAGPEPGDVAPGLAEVGGASGGIGRVTSVFCLVLFCLLLALLPVLRHATGNQELAMADTWYRTGALVFGGGHVVLPLLESETVGNGWISKDAFLSGYGMAQALPGPLFSFAGYLGMTSGGLNAGLLAIALIFLPGFLLVIGVLPHWDRLRSVPVVTACLAGIHPAVVGILAAALYDPLWTSSIRGGGDLAAAVALGAMLFVWNLPPWAVVLGGAFLGLALTLTGVS